MSRFSVQAFILETVRHQWVLLGLLLICSFALAKQEVVAPRVTVLFENPADEPYAQRVAAEAERALDILIPLFGHEPPPITLRLEDTTDLYNALASPLPRPNVGLRRLFPTEVALSYRAEDDLRLLLIHELTHLMQSSYLEGRGSLGIGLVAENVANVPPAWLVEGLAVWAESEFTAGGRRDDALTRGLLQRMALAGTWPTLADVSLSSYGAWPGGQAEYLFGVGFTGHLIEKHGLEVLKGALARHNAGGFFRPFASSWEQAAGTNLWDEWRLWQRVVTAKAQARAALVERAGRAGIPRTESGWYTRAPALSPDGKRLAWVGWPPALMLADTQNGELRNVRTLRVDRLPTGLEWLDTHTLLYARTVPRPGHSYSDIFTLDTRTGRETPLTQGARAVLPAPLPGGCILYVTDDAVRSSLVRFCPHTGVRTVRYRTAEGTHIVGLATSRKGRVALSVWRRGFVDLALLEEGNLRFLTRDPAQDLEPSWRGENELLFRADRQAQGGFDIYAFSLADGRLYRLSETVGGAFMPEAGGGGVWFTALGARGYDIAWLPGAASGRALSSKKLRLPQIEGESVSSENLRPDFAVRPYSPFSSLRPYGWVPTAVGATLAPLGVSLEASLLAQDDSLDHSARLTLGFDSSRTDVLAGLYGYARYDYGGGLSLRATPRPLRFGVRAGTWSLTPHLSRISETAVGLEAEVSARLPQDDALLGWGVRAGLVHLFGQPAGLLLSADATLSYSTQRADIWGYRTRGWRGAVTGVLSPTGEAPSLGVWLDGAYVHPAGSLGRLEFGVRAGYRPAWPVPFETEGDMAASVSAGVTRSLPLEWRFGDGLYALERVTLEPRLRLWAADVLYLGGDLSVSLDTVLSYGAPVSFSGTLGYARGFWTRLGVRLPL